MATIAKFRALAQRHGEADAWRGVQQRCHQVNQLLNAFISLNADAQPIAYGNGIAGVPIALKDIFCTAGIATTCGSKMLEKFIPAYDAHVVERLAAANTVIVGKANMDEFAMGSTNENSYFGACKNPWDPTRVAGGSSGGCAASVSSGCVPVAIGSDTGGSVRLPAAYCGVSALKPTYGRVSRWGLIAFASSFDQAGIFAHSAADIAPVLASIAGHDPRDSTSAAVAVDAYSKQLTGDIAGVRIGIPSQFFNEQLDPAIRQRIDAAITVMQTLGATVLPIELASMAASLPAYYVLALAECSSNMSRYDGIRYGYRCADPQSLEDMYMRSRSEGFGAELQRRILLGTFVLSHGYHDAYYVHAQKLRRKIKNDFVAAFTQIDVIAAPVAPSIAPKLGQLSDPVTMYQQDLYTVAANLAGIPALAFPLQPLDEMPIGMQLMANYFDESLLLRVVDAFQRATVWHDQVPSDETMGIR